MNKHDPQPPKFLEIQARLDRVTRFLQAKPGRYTRAGLVRACHNPPAIEEMERYGITEAEPPGNCCCLFAGVKVGYRAQSF